MLELTRNHLRLNFFDHFLFFRLTDILTDIEEGHSTENNVIDYWELINLGSNTNAQRRA